MKKRNRNRDLGNDEFGDALGESTFLGGKDHFEHVTLELLHNDKDPLGSFKHTLQVNDARVRQILQDTHFVLQLISLFCWEAHLVDHFNRYRTISFTVST